MYTDTEIYFSDLLVIIAVLQTAQGGKILKKLTKELKKVSISFIYCFIFTFFKTIFLNTYRC